MSERKVKTGTRPNTSVFAGAIVAFAVILTKFAEMAEHIDFLLSNGNKYFRNFWISWVSWIWLIVFIAAIFWIALEVRRQPVLKKMPTWGLLFSISFLTLVIGSIASIIATASFPNIIMAWGSNESCKAVVNGNKIRSFSKEYNVAIICMVEDHSIAPLDRKDISISNPFSIMDEPIEIATPFPKEKLEREKLEMENAVSNLRASGISKSNIQISIQSNVDYYIVLVPKNIPTAKIDSLQQITDFGGKIMTEKYFS